MEHQSRADDTVVSAKCRKQGMEDERIADWQRSNNDVRDKISLPPATTDSRNTAPLNSGRLSVHPTHSRWRTLTRSVRAPTTPFLRKLEPPYGRHRAR